MLVSRRLLSLAKLLGFVSTFALLVHMGTVLYASRNNTSAHGIYQNWSDSLSNLGKYGGNAAGVNEYAPRGVKPVKGALVALVRNDDLFGMRKAVRQLEDRWNHKYNYPYIFLNDQPFTREFKQGIRDLTNAPVQFGQLEPGTWGYPSWIDQDKARNERETAKYIKGHSESYRFMCRFQSGFIHKHPLLKDLEYYWRIEPDVDYYCDIDFDPFLFMKKNGLKYGWNIAPSEYAPTVRTLWNTTKEFMNKNPQMIPDKNLLDWVQDDKGEYNMCHFWSNFEIVDLSLYRSPQYEAYFNHLDRSGGFYYERWGDAPIHSLAVAMFLRKSQVHYFDVIGYRHPAMAHCPKGSDVRGKCVCDPSDGWANDFSCAKRWRQVS
ncbi:hypothetical protein GGI04_000184 [Coemansia thaxteri]|nr:hypothetical protein GGI04_000184 [Coemansia thaxteri]